MMTKHTIACEMELKRRRFFFHLYFSSFKIHTIAYCQFVAFVDHHLQIRSCHFYFIRFGFVLLFCCVLFCCSFSLDCQSFCIENHHKHNTNTIWYMTDNPRRRVTYVEMKRKKMKEERASNSKNCLTR